MRRYNVEPERLAVAFSRVLRGAGVDVPVGGTLTFARGLAEVGLAQRDGVYWTGRATLLTRPEQIATYDRVFAGFATYRRRAGREIPILQLERR